MAAPRSVNRVRRRPLTPHILNRDLQTEVFIQKDRSVAMFDKRLSQRFRNSFPRRTNSYINRLQEAALDANGNQSGSSGSLPGTSPSPAADLAQAF